MAKTSRKLAGEKRRKQDAFTTYCVRLSATERDLLEKALTASGWIPTRFIRQAVLDRAAHVVNLNTRTSFPFELIARRLAQQLCKPKVLIGEEKYPEAALTDVELFLDSLPNEIGGRGVYAVTEPPPLTVAEAAQLRDAFRLGGAEFHAKVSEYCDQLLAEQRTDLPSPIDPASLE
jgi:uncharacterized protein (DUF1778 family)